MLTRKKFSTTDTKGCRFECTCYLVTEMKFINGKICRVVVESKYDAMGKTAATLKELKAIVGIL